MSKEAIILVEDHHEALGEWKRLGIKDAPLVHVDAHIDFGFYRAKTPIEAFKEAEDFADLKKHLEISLAFTKQKKDFESQLNIGNYIYPAMRDRIVDSFHWVVPGARKELRASEKILARILKNLKSRDPHKQKNRIYNKDFLITDILTAKRQDSPVLLDIDVDYLMFDSLKKTALVKSIGKRKPWIYPDELVKLLKEKFPKRLCTTIAYSVKGGFTPIFYKFFGDEIGLRLKTSRLGVELESVFSLRNRGIEYYHKKEMDVSFDYFKEAATILEKTKDSGDGFRDKFFAHLWLWLFNICWQRDGREEARFYYRKALQFDPTLRTEDNNFGKLFLIKKNLKNAEKEFRKILFCDPLDKNALRGMRKIKFMQRNNK